MKRQLGIASLIMALSLTSCGTNDLPAPRTTAIGMANQPAPSDASYWDRFASLPTTGTTYPSPPPPLPLLPDLGASRLAVTAAAKAEGCQDPQITGLLFEIAAAARNDRDVRRELQDQQDAFGPLVMLQIKSDCGSLPDCEARGQRYLTALLNRSDYSFSRPEEREQARTLFAADFIRYAVCSGAGGPPTPFP